MQSFREVIAEGKPLLFDGALGTELYKRGVFINRCFEEVNLKDPQTIKSIHREYLDAGAKVLTSNSWGANRTKLSAYNLQDQLDVINKKSVELAKEQAGDQAYVAGSVGPLGVRIEPFGPMSFEEARAIFKEQVLALVLGGADLISLETFVDLSEIEQAILATREVTDIPIVASVVVEANALSPLGTPLDLIIKKLNDLDCDVIGLNCSLGPQPMLSLMEKVREMSHKPLCVQPNAGLPKMVDGRQIYMSTPEYFAHFTKEFFRLGVQFVGACCGSSPAHIKAMANTLRYSQAVHNVEVKENKYSHTNIKDTQTQEKTRIPLKDKSNWSEKLAKGELVSSVELLPPAGLDPSAIIERSRQMKAYGVDAINIPDGPRASARMSAVLTSIMVEQQAGIETVLHYTCRDRNLLGMQSDMLGLHAIGIRNVLLITGDPPKIGDYPDMTGVFDVDAIGLTNMVHRLNGGIDLGGKSINEVSALSIGVGVNPVHKDFDYEMKRFAWKVGAGAEWAITQPVFDVEALLRFLDYLDKHKLSIPIIAGIWPLTSYRNATFMNNEVPGVEIPEKIIERMASIKDTEAAKQEGVAIARDMLKALEGRVSGFQVSAPFGRADLALQVLE